MLQSTSQHRIQWALAMRAIGRQLGLKYELPQELLPELTALPTPKDREIDPYAEIVGTC
jgi:hypothetical protein